MTYDACVVQVGSPCHVVLFITNIFLPGIGTIISAFLQKGGINCWALAVGLLQLICAAFLLGWIWSIIHGWLN